MGTMYRAPVNKYRSKPLPHASKKIDAEQNKKIINLEKKVRRINVGEESKWKDTLHNGLALTPAPISLSLLNGFVQGVADSNRIANKVQAMSVQFKGAVLMDPDCLIGAICRIIIFWDHTPNGVAPAFSDVLDTTTVTSASANTVFAPYNLDNQPRFKILKDKMFTLNGQTEQRVVVATGTTDQLIPAASHPVKFKIPLKRMCNYGLGNAGTIADISSGALYGMYLSTIPTGSQPPVLYAGIRFLYRDA